MGKAKRGARYDLRQRVADVVAIIGRKKARSIASRSVIARLRFLRGCHGKMAMAACLLVGAREAVYFPGQC